MLHAAASSSLGLSLVAISLGLAGENGISERLGRNAAFASAGTGIAAATMGACGVYLSSRAVFFLAGALAVPALFALSRIGGERSAQPPTPRAARRPIRSRWRRLRRAGAQQPFLAFALCIMVFHLANAAMLPLAASMVTLRSREAATIMVAAAIVVPQFTMTALSPWVGRTAHRRGRRPLLLLGFAALALRGFLFSVTSAPELLVLAQVLDGVSAATLAVLVPLTIVDLTRAHGHFNLAQGMAGCAMGLGAAASTILAGYVTDRFGSHSAFDLLTIFAVGGLLACALIMPETRPRAGVSR